MRLMKVLAGIALAGAAASPLADAGKPAAPFVPGLGEIMAMQQMRHAKLWLAGSAANWPLAKYELAELREGFEDTTRFHATHDGVALGALVASLTPAPLTALDKAIEKKSGKAFSAAFDGLSAACNTCHKVAQKGFIRIVRPRVSAYPNQDFKPGQKR